jgi:outer membrane protein OmpA-like peptidoglycan-associated protein
VLDRGSWTGFQNKRPAFNVDYWRGLTSKVDLSARYTGAFYEYPFPNKTPDGSQFEGLFSQLDLALNARLLDASKTINPYITAGIAGFNYRKDFGALVPLGVGIMFNLGNEAMITTSMQYRVGITNNATDHLQYGLTFLHPLTKAPKTVETPTLPVVQAPVVEAPKDTDGDGMIDEKDLCPTQAGPASLNGCPDKDGDGIADKDDKCPDSRGTAKYSGCPVPDTDKDGVNDEEDKCPNQAGVSRYGGCPIPDGDGDGVNDENDKCPRVAGTAANNGCPTLEQFNFNYKNVQFATGSSTLTSTAKVELDKLVGILNKYPELNISIDGYTDNTGKVESNKVLSQKRADAVKTYLVGKGIADTRLKATGYGIENPIADNATAAGRAQNRRVEFKASE